MKNEEINLKFLEFLGLILSSIGDETGNSDFQNLYKSLDTLQNENSLSVDFDIFYLATLVHIILVIHGPDKFAETIQDEKDILQINYDDRMKDLVSDLHNRHLKKHLHRFCSKYGVQMPDLETYGIVIKKLL